MRWRSRTGRQYLSEVWVLSAAACQEDTGEKAAYWNGLLSHSHIYTVTERSQTSFEIGVVVAHIGGCTVSSLLSLKCFAAFKGQLLKWTSHEVGHLGLSSGLGRYLDAYVVHPHSSCVASHQQASSILVDYSSVWLPCDTWTSTKSDQSHDRRKS